MELIIIGLLIALEILLIPILYFIGRKVIRRAIFEGYVAVMNDLSHEDTQNLLKVTAMRLGQGFFGQIKLGNKIPSISIEKAAGYAITKGVDWLLGGGGNPLEKIKELGKKTKSVTESFKIG